MKLDLRSLVFVVFAAALAACGGGTPPVEIDATPPADTVATPDVGIDAPACGGEALCARSINECGVTLTMPQCLTFYDPATTTCADIAGYTTCNCACITEATCGEYFACGMTCFEDWC